MAHVTPYPYRILTPRQRARRNWLTQSLTGGHRVAFDPTVYAGTVFPSDPRLEGHPLVDVVDTSLGHQLGLVRRDAS